MDRPPEILARKEPDMPLHQIHPPRMCDGHPQSVCNSGCGVDCAFNEAMVPVTPKDYADEVFFRPDYGWPIPVRAKTPLHIRALDWLGNLPRKAVKWWDGLNELARIGAVVALIAGCAVFAVACVGGGY